MNKVGIFVTVIIITFVFSCSQEKGSSGIYKVTNNEIKVDGSSEKWDGQGMVLGEVGLPSDGGMGGFDVKTLQLAFDEKNLYFLIEMNKGIDQYFAEKEGGGTIGTIYLDVDGDTTTGCLNYDLFGFGKLNGFDVQIWVPVGVSYHDDISEPLVSYAVTHPTEEKNRFEMSKKVTEASSLEKPEMIQFKGNFVEFAIPLETIGIKNGTSVRGVISEFANSYQQGGASAFTFMIQ